MNIYINGIPQNLDDFDGTEGISFSYRRKNDSGESGLSFSPELKVSGAAFTYLRSIFIDVPNPELTSALFDAYSDCCFNDDGSPVHLFTGIIKGDEIQWCEYPGCEITITVLDNTEDALALACLKNTMIWDKVTPFGGGPNTLGEDQFRTAPKTTYCYDIKPAFLQELILLFAILMIVVLYPIALVVGVILTAVNALIFIVGGTPIGNGNVNAIDDAIGLVQQIQQLIVGCGYKHKTPFIHSYLSNICAICGLNLQSSVFGPGGDYNNTMRLDAQYKPGRLTDTRILSAYELNKPNLNGLQFIEELKQFNLDWKVSGSALIIERKDFFSGGTWIDMEQLNDSEIVSLCFDAFTDPARAYAEYMYSKDGIDNTGDETNPDWVEKVIDWNVPVNPAQRGLYSVTFRYSTAQFRLDSGRDGISPLDKPIYNTFLPALNQFQNVMLMERGLAGYPRLLQWDGVSDVNDARIKKYASAVETGLFDYNTDWWVKTAYSDAAGTAHDTLYQRFFVIDDPRVTGIKRRPYTLTISVNDCRFVKGLDVSVTDKLDKINRIAKGGAYVDGTIEEITFNWSNNEITVSGRV